MAVDDAYLLALRRFEDRRSGFAEEFLDPILGGARTVAVLSRPLSPAVSVGWVVCHSFASEQLHLAHLDAKVARALASEGFPVLRYHGQGYGDSERGQEAISLTSHLDDASDAVDLLRAESGAARIGVIGARFGAAVAALTAQASRLSLLALCDPVTDGASYLREYLLANAAAALTGAAGGPPTEAVGVGPHDPRAPGSGSADVGGFLLSSRAYEEIAGIDLLRDPLGIDGAALVIGLSEDGQPPRTARAVAGHLVRSGADPSLVTLPYPLAQEFGRFHLRALGNRAGKTDVRAALDGAIARTIVAWASSWRDDPSRGGP
jgi:pimeloyl-ACP methyl ester carboxylesterase